jgi:hypothetical protein
MAMRSVRNLFVAVGLAAGLGLIPIAVMAAEPTTIVDSVFGVEVAFGQSGLLCPEYSTFAGFANGSAPGFWNATVVHPPLNSTPFVPTPICGGTFALHTQLDEDPAVVHGNFKSTGTITPLPALCFVFFSVAPCSSATPSGAACSQNFTVNGGLQNVGTGTSNTGTGNFSATLTHYGRWSASSGKCDVVVPPPPTVVGTVTLIF